MRIQEFPETTRKIILWSVVIILGIILFFWWGKGVTQTLKTTSFPKVPQEFQENLQQTKEAFPFQHLRTE